MAQLKNNNKFLFDISFPVYTISKTYIKIWEEDKITYIETSTGIYVLDNKNMLGDTLGKRRLRINNTKLYTPRLVVQNIEQLLHCKVTEYIDNLGCVFTYVKKNYVPLKYFKVIDRQMYKDCYIIRFDKINNPIQVSTRKVFDINYVGFLITPTGYITYEYSDIMKKDTRRKI